MEPKFNDKDTCSRKVEGKFETNRGGDTVRRRESNVDTKADWSDVTKS